MPTYSYVPAGTLRPHPRNVRTHSKKQIKQIAHSIREFGFTAPIICDEAGFVLCGHGRLLAANELGLETLPVVMVSGLDDARKRALMLADNKIAENAGWDRKALAFELQTLAIELPEFNLDLSITGFELGEIVAIMDDQGTEKADPLDAFAAPPEFPTTRPGDLWLAGEHRLLCGDARLSHEVERLMAGQKAGMVFIDPPYNVPIAGHVQGRGKVQHPEFDFASGEMSSDEFIAFLTQAFAPLAAASADGSIHYVCMDWRHVLELITAGKVVYGDALNMIVWNKTSPGQGSFYRSQHELIFVFKNGSGPHLNGVAQGKFGRNRSNVWTYPGATGFRKDRGKELAWHPTVKPVAMVADAMRDCSMPNAIALDTFLGSGTTLMAAERIGRRSYAMEFAPRYVDVAIKRWQEYTRRDAILEETGQTFDEVTAERLPVESRVRPTNGPLLLTYDGEA